MARAPAYGEEETICRTGLHAETITKVSVSSASTPQSTKPSQPLPVGEDQGAQR